MNVYRSDIVVGGLRPTRLGNWIIQEMLVAPELL